MLVFQRGGFWLVSAALVAIVSGCGSSVRNRAPVEDRVSSAVRPASVIDPRTQPVKQPPGFENAGKAGYYVVKPGETLIRIGLDTGQSHKDIARWNALENPNKIEVGQVLRVVPPAGPEMVVTKPVASAAITTVALPAAAPASAASATPAATAPAKPVAAAAKPAAVPATPGTAVPAGTAVASTGADAAPVPTPATAPLSSSIATTLSDDDLGWIWPGKGPVLAGFEEPKNKGLDIGGTTGDPVVAAADGKVVYAGAGLRGYGNLVILKHNTTYLSAYAHNQSLMVKEDQTVKKGQKIAEMGSSDADRVKLHFEVRKQGKPVDPVKYLPARP